MLAGMEMSAGSIYVKGVHTPKKRTEEEKFPLLLDTVESDDA